MKVEVPIIIKDRETSADWGLSLTHRVELDEDFLLDGPVGPRVAVIDFDPTTGLLRPGVAVAMGIVVWGEVRIDLIVKIGLSLLCLGVICLYFHGNLERSKPPVAHLTAFYFYLSLGGVSGGVLVGLVTNWLAIQMIFRPMEPRRYLGVFHYQGMFPKRQKEISADYGRITANEILTPRNLILDLLLGRS